MIYNSVQCLLNETLFCSKWFVEIKMLNERLVEVANAFDRDEFYVVEKFFYKILKAHTMLIF